MSTSNNTASQKGTTKDACDLYKIGRTTFWRMTKQDGFPAPIRFGRAVRWDLAAIDAYMQQGANQ